MSRFKSLSKPRAKQCSNKPSAEEKRETLKDELEVKFEVFINNQVEKLFQYIDEMPDDLLERSDKIEITPKLILRIRFSGDGNSPFTPV